VGCDIVSLGKLLLMFRWTTTQEDYSVLKMKALRFSAMSGTTRPITQYHIIGDWKFRNTDTGTSNFAWNNVCLPHKAYFKQLTAHPVI